MMITIEMTQELENALRQAAAKAGIAPDRYIVELLQQDLKQVAASTQSGKRLAQQETILLQQINSSLSQIEWQHYQSLLAKRQAEALTSEEQIELIALSDKIEAANMRRIEALAQLARLRETTVSALMVELGLKPMSHG